MGKSDKIDMQRLAELANVARSTVSRALNDSPLVNEKTKRRIKELAREHNYVLNVAARSFRHQKTNIVSVVLMLDTASGQHVSDPFFLEMTGNIADSLSARGYDMLLSHAPISSAGEFVQSRIYSQAEGIIFVGQGDTHEELNKLAEMDRPIVVWGAPLPKRKYRIVGSDNVQGGYLSTKHLISLGCRHIAFFGEKAFPETALRYEGYCRALDEANLPVDPELELAVPFEAKTAHDKIEKFLDRIPNVDGIVCCSDLIAISTISSLNHHGLQVPGDVAVVGYDNIDLAARVAPSLTTINQNIGLAGKTLVDKLMNLIDGKRVRDAIMPADIMIRRSSVK